MQTSRNQSIVGAALVGVLVLLAASVLIWSGVKHERSAFDQDKFHIRAVERFSQQWPRFDFRDYESATTPGYHVVVATVHRFVTHDLGVLRVCGAIFTIGFLATLAWWLAARVGAQRAVLLTLPLAASMYVLFPAAWLLPDNAAWWLVLSVLLVALNPQPATASRALLGASLLVLLAIVRQSHIWAAGPLVVAWWLAWPQSSADPLARTGLVPPVGEAKPAALRALVALAMCIPAALLLFAFARLWHGLTPPAFGAAGSALTTRDYTRVSGMSPATPALILALFGIFGTFFIGLLWPSFKRPGWIAPVLAGIVIGLVVSLIPRTDYSYSNLNHDMSRFSGLWNVVKALTPEGWRSSPVIVVPAAVGGAWLALWLRALPRREAWILGAALLAFAAAHTAGALSWQRYFEPMVLVWLALASAIVLDVRRARWALCGPIALAVMQGANTALALMRNS